MVYKPTYNWGGPSCMGPRFFGGSESAQIRTLARVLGLISSHGNYAF